jgi:hypothetical protein
VAHSSPGVPDGAVFAGWGGSRFWLEWGSARVRGPFGTLSAGCPRRLDWFLRKRRGLVVFSLFFGGVFFFALLVRVFFVFGAFVFFVALFFIVAIVFLVFLEFCLAPGVVAEVAETVCDLPRTGSGAAFATTQPALKDA